MFIWESANWRIWDNEQEIEDKYMSVPVRYRLKVNDEGKWRHVRKLDFESLNSLLEDLAQAMRKPK